MNQLSSTIATQTEIEDARPAAFEARTAAILAQMATNSAVIEAVVDKINRLHRHKYTCRSRDSRLAQVSCDRSPALESCQSVAAYNAPSRVFRKRCTSVESAAYRNAATVIRDALLHCLNWRSPQLLFLPYIIIVKIDKYSETITVERPAPARYFLVAIDPVEYRNC